MHRTGVILLALVLARMHDAVAQRSA